jgi:hypothetical protein
MILVWGSPGTGRAATWSGWVPSCPSFRRVTRSWAGCPGCPACSAPGTSLAGVSAPSRYSPGLGWGYSSGRSGLFLYRLLVIVVSKAGPSSRMFMASASPLLISDPGRGTGRMPTPLSGARAGPSRPGGVTWPGASWPGAGWSRLLPPNAIGFLPGSFALAVCGIMAGVFLGLPGPRLTGCPGRAWPGAATSVTSFWGYFLGLPGPRFTGWPGMACPGACWPGASWPGAGMSTPLGCAVFLGLPGPRLTGGVPGMACPGACWPGASWPGAGTSVTCNGYFRGLPTGLFGPCSTAGYFLGLPGPRLTGCCCGCCSTGAVGLRPSTLLTAPDWTASASPRTSFTAWLGAPGLRVSPVRWTLMVPSISLPIFRGLPRPRRSDGSPGSVRRRPPPRVPNPGTFPLDRRRGAGSSGS